MTYKCQCPRCQAIYPIPSAKATEPTAGATCPKCKQHFYVAKNLVTNNDNNSDHHKAAGNNDNSKRSISAKASAPKDDLNNPAHPYLST